MSLFADSRYQWRETYFVLFDHQHRPRAADVKRILGELGPRIEIHELRVQPLQCRIGRPRIAGDVRRLTECEAFLLRSERKSQRLEALRWCTR